LAISRWGRGLFCEDDFENFSGQAGSADVIRMDTAFIQQGIVVRVGVADGVDDGVGGVVIVDELGEDLGLSRVARKYIVRDMVGGGKVLLVGEIEKHDAGFGGLSMDGGEEFVEVLLELRGDIGNGVVGVFHNAAIVGADVQRDQSGFGWKIRKLLGQDTLDVCTADAEIHEVSGDAGFAKGTRDLHSVAAACGAELVDVNGMSGERSAVGFDADPEGDAVSHGDIEPGRRGRGGLAMALIWRKDVALTGLGPGWRLGRCGGLGEA
jgi:hypothetical protein